MAARAQRIAPVGGADPPAAAGPVAEPATRPAGDQA
jgi:hypothetical protein